jgi:DNA processing protein
VRAQTALLVSQFATEYPTLPANFAIRNRTMALLTDATVIVEAGGDYTADSEVDEN